MTYFTTRFPECISFDAIGGPGYQTTVVTTDGGHESRNQDWEQARCEYEVSHAARRQDYAAQLLAFYRQVRGRTHSFPFKDPLDYSVPDDSGTGVFVEAGSDSPATQYQMFKKYGTGSLAEYRKITRPVSGTVTVTGGSVASISYTTGIVTMTSGAPTSWDGQFDVPCRFDSDLMGQRIIDKNAGRGFIVGWDSVRIVEVRE